MQGRVGVDRLVIAWHARSQYFGVASKTLNEQIVFQRASYSLIYDFPLKIVDTVIDYKNYLANLLSYMLKQNCEDFMSKVFPIDRYLKVFI